ncbi:hypothetical protein D0T12_16660 [Actinomadura spongiicola]|uniref:Uncharacterized protein n=1 Tax=Actinomadura spongiicola TaxID=2303421 RepID=A0A372GG68_9ACTN|nr:hypothetical protein [Actinomadura spongiicola]RFS84361.1 hypothetical protein D0T12_16660 [Actinomadura spongiicola]
MLWVLQRRTLGATLTGHTRAGTSLAFSPDGQTLASGSADHSVIIWPLNTTTAHSHPLNTANRDDPTT